MRQYEFNNSTHYHINPISIGLMPVFTLNTKKAALRRPSFVYIHIYLYISFINQYVEGRRRHL